jgi:hypothetical protein
VVEKLKKLVEALESGDYHYISGRTSCWNEEENRQEFCTLGVAGDHVLDCEWLALPKPSSYRYPVLNGTRVKLLDLGLMLGLEAREVGELIFANDKGKKTESFQEAILYLEQLIQVREDSEEEAD